MNKVELERNIDKITQNIRAALKRSVYVKTHSYKPSNQKTDNKKT